MSNFAAFWNSEMSLDSHVDGSIRQYFVIAKFSVKFKWKFADHIQVISGCFLPRCREVNKLLNALTGHRVIGSGILMYFVFTIINLWSQSTSYLFNNN